MLFVMFGFQILWEKWVVFQTLIDKVSNQWCFSMLFYRPKVLQVVGQPNHAYVMQWFSLGLILLPYCCFLLVHSPVDDME